MKILLLSRYTRLGASSRLRMLQYLPAILDAGLEVEAVPFFEEGDLQRRYAGNVLHGGTLSAFLKRISSMRSGAGANLLWIEKEALPWLPWLIERSLLPKSIPIVSDYDDATFHRYDLHPSRIVRWLLGRKIDNVMAASDLVIAGNGYLADRARAAGAKRVEIVPTVVDAEAYSVSPPPGEAGTVSIGWIGSPSTWTAYMAPMLPMLADVAGAHGARLRVVGAGKAAEPHSLVDSLPWSEQDEVAQIQRMDIGIMPLDDSPWARGKCGYKLIQYMACGLPVVASPVGANAQIVEHGVNGFLAGTEREWRDALAMLLGDPALRQRMGMAGRDKVEREYSLQVYGPRVAQLLYNVMQRKR
jgi:glycosyltransferase involved in cell wall biosynthesis